MVEDPEVSDLQTIGAWIRETRNDLEITQTELAEHADISPSRLSRLENGKGNPSYEAVYSIYTELKSLQETITVEQLLEAKQNQYDDLAFEYVTPEDSCAEAAELMSQYEISQLPVIDQTHSTATITEGDLMDIDYTVEDVTVNKVASSSLPEVPVTESQQTVRNLLRTNPAVLLVATEQSDLPAAVGKYAGIVTASDFRNQAIKNRN